MSTSLRTGEKGKVYLVGAGPGDPELLTLRAAKLISTADCILHDDLVSAEILEHARSDALIENVGKRCGSKAISQEEINVLLVTRAQSGMSVVRLKSGDPMLFGRAAEEMNALDETGVPYEIVPGVSAAFAAAAELRASFTDRRLASKVMFLTGHRAASGGESERPSWGDLPSDATLAIYMPGSDYQKLARELLASGLAPDTPCAVVSKAGHSVGQTLTTSLRMMSMHRELPAPSIVLIGKTLQRQCEAPPDMTMQDVTGFPRFLERI